MRIETTDKVQKILDDFEHDTVRALTKSAYRKHIEADGEALATIGEPMDWAVINEASVAYIEEYRDRLLKNGSTLVNGQEYPWLGDWTKEARVRVTEIFEQGIRDGLHPARKETTIGTYPKESTAYRLQELFHDRKSHAAMIARTETQHIRSTAKLNRWTERGYTHVEVHDGDGANPCDECKETDGVIWEIEYAQTHQTEHPNCVRRFIPRKAAAPAEALEGGE
jgi:hypothetical protein